MAEIKISELSIGDWVRYESTVRTVPMKVLEIGDKYTMCDGQIYITGETEGGRMFCEITELKPIPLTPEILEKNGFEKVESQWYMCEHNGIHISVIVWENQRGRIEISYTSPFDDDNPLYIADFTANIPHIAVHHLQRVLLLAGVEKEIEV